MKIEGEMCSFCLESCENFKAVTGNMENILDTLLLKIDLTVITEPLICKNCEGMIIKCFEFKTSCLSTQNCIVSFLSSTDDVKLDLKDIYLSRNLTDIGVPEDQDICGFCMGMVNNYSAISLGGEERDVMLEKMMEECVPELDLSIIKKPVICASCHGSLENYFHFVMNCLIMGVKNKKHCETPNISNKGQIELGSSLPPAIKDETTREVDGNWSNIIKVEEPFCEKEKHLDGREICDVGSTIKLEEIFFDDIEGANKDVKNQSECFMDLDDQEINNERQFASENMLALEEEGNKIASIKIEEIFCATKEAKCKGESLVEEDQQFLLNKEIDIKMDENDFNRLKQDIILPQSNVTRRLHRNATCSLQNLEGAQQVSEITMYKCDFCLYQTAFKSALNVHLMLHKNPSEVTMYKCDNCLYQTMYKSALKRHLLVHKDSSEVTMYKYNTCSYQTKNSLVLKNHLLAHNDPSEVTMYKCNSCSYQTRNSLVLKGHLLVHKDPSEVTMFKCNSCSYQTKYKKSLKDHFLTHKDPSEVTMYTCESCSFQTKRKHSLKEHRLTHKDPSEVVMYKCDYCPYENKHKYVVKKHSVVHKDASEVTLYRCDYCSYQTRRKDDQKRHLLRHKNPSEVTMHKCDSCSFQTKHKYNLKLHTKIHKDPSQLTMYKCEYCKFQSKHRSGLMYHKLTHKNSQK